MTKVPLIGEYWQKIRNIWIHLSYLFAVFTLITLMISWNNKKVVKLCFWALGKSEKIVEVLEFLERWSQGRFGTTNSETCLQAEEIFQKQREIHLALVSLQFSISISRKDWISDEVFLSKSQKIFRIRTENWKFIHIVWEQMCTNSHFLHKFSIFGCFLTCHIQIAIVSKVLSICLHILNNLRHF